MRKKIVDVAAWNAETLWSALETAGIAKWHRNSSRRKKKEEKRRRTITTTTIKITGLYFCIVKVH